MLIETIDCLLENKKLFPEQLKEKRTQRRITVEAEGTIKNRGILEYDQGKTLKEQMRIVGKE